MYHLYGMYYIYGMYHLYGMYLGIESISRTLADAKPTYVQTNELVPYFTRVRTSTIGTQKSANSLLAATFP